MPANNVQKLKLLTLIQILQDHTDPQQGLSMPQIIEKLAERGIKAERKALYRDFDALREVGFEVRTLPRRPVEYVLVRDSLGFDDVMMLVDIVQSCRFITERKSNHLVKSLKGLVSDRERKLLERRVHVRGRVKSQNDSVFSSVDAVHEALRRKRKVEFLYFSYDTDLRRRSRHAGKRYELTPVKVVYADNNYYLAAYDDEADMVKTFRIDRMELVRVGADAASRADAITRYELEDFSYLSFGMFHGEPEVVTLRVESAFVDALVDRFGRDVEVASADDDSVQVRCKVRVSSQFFGWVAGLDGGVKICGPAAVVDGYESWLKSLLEGAAE